MSKGRLLKDCPLGTRFRYIEGEEDVFVFLQRGGVTGRGVVGIWQGLVCATRQGMYAATDSDDPDEWNKLIVYPIEGEGS